MTSSIPHVQDVPDISFLTTAAKGGSQTAWNAIVDRYAPLIWSIGRTHGLDRRDIDDMGCAVWLWLLESIENDADPEELPERIAASARSECIRVLRTREQDEHSANSTDLSGSQVITNRRADSIRPMPAAQKLVDRATQILPAQHRIRYRDEYRSELYELAASKASRLAQFMYAVRLLDRAWILRAELLAPNERAARP